jgi:hypothetical protein
MRVRTCDIWCGALVLLVALAPAAAAAPLDKRTTFTFSASFTVPGATLPAGSYVFVIANQLHGRDVVQVLNAGDGTVHAMFLTLRTTRDKPVDRTELRFIETASDVPMAIKSWWYPAETHGYEFLYSRAQARLLGCGEVPFDGRELSRGSAKNAPARRRPIASRGRMSASGSGTLVAQSNYVAGD